MAQTHKFRKGKSLFTTTLSAGIGTGTGDTITPNSVTGLPTDTEITLTIDRVDSGGTATPTKMERITGTISSGNLINYTRGIDGSTEQAHSSGAVVEYIWNADDLNDIVDGILVCHAQDGNIKSGAQINDTSANHQYVLEVSELSADRTVTLPLLTGNDEFVFKDHSVTMTNKTLTSPVVSGAGGTTAGQQGYDGTNKAIYIGDGTSKQSIYTSAWKSFTPSWTNLTPGSGTNTGYYCVIGKTVHFRTKFGLGSGSSVGTTPTLTLPVSINSDYFPFAVIGNVSIEDSGTALFTGVILANGSVWCVDTSAAAAKTLTITSSVPMTWTTNDYLLITGTYESA